MRESVRAEAHRDRDRCRELIDSGTVTVTLNGKPASVAGFALDFARVHDTATGLSAEWSWNATYLNLTKNKGAFTS